MFGVVGSLEENLDLFSPLHVPFEFDIQKILITKPQKSIPTQSELKRLSD